MKASRPEKNCRVLRCFLTVASLSLPQDLQSALKQAGAETVDHVGTALEAEADTVAKDFQSQGITVNKLTPEQAKAWLQPIQPGWEKWVKDMAGKGLQGQKVIDECTSAVAKLGLR